MARVEELGEMEEVVDRVRLCEFAGLATRLFDHTHHSLHAVVSELTDSSSQLERESWRNEWKTSLGEHEGASLEINGYTYSNESSI